MYLTQHAREHKMTNKEKPRNDQKKTEEGASMHATKTLDKHGRHTIVMTMALTLMR